MTRSRYIGGFIGAEAGQKRWLGEKIEGCWDSVDTLAGVAHRHPQTAYAGLKKYLQHEWAFVQRITTGKGMKF